jgi:fumarylacetoacetase
MYANPQNGMPEYQPTRKLDYELEMGLYIGGQVPFGQTVNADEAEDHIFGFTLINDWSSRDIQIYESMPAGPIHSKSFGTTVSPWVVMPEALDKSRVRPFEQEEGQAPLHMFHKSLENKAYDIICHASLTRAGGKSTRLSASNTKHMYFTPAQLVAHRSSSRCGLVTGELVGMGTVSSPKEVRPDRSLARAGCLFEMTWDATRELRQTGGMFLEDGDAVTLEAWALGPDGIRIGFGEVSGFIRPAIT